MRRRITWFSAAAVVMSMLLCFAVQAMEGASDDPFDEGRIVLYINGIEEQTDEQIAQYRPEIDGQEAKLSIEGEFRESLRFLQAMNYSGLDLYWKFPDFYLLSEESGPGSSLAGVKNLKALTIQDFRYGYYSREDVFPDLEQLTLLSREEPQVFGNIFSRQMPSLRSLTVRTDDARLVLEGPNEYMVFPSGLEKIDIYENGELLSVQEPWPAKFIGSVLYCCPDVLVNGVPVQDLTPESEGDISAEEKVELAKTHAAVVSLLDGIYHGTVPVSEELPKVQGKLLFAAVSREEDYYLGSYSYFPIERHWRYTQEASPEELQSTFGEDTGVPEWVPREVPQEQLASGLDDADTMVIIYEDFVRLRDRVLYDTCVVMQDLASGTVYAPYSAYPSLDETQWFDPDLATRQVMESYGGTVAQAQTGRGRFGGTGAGADGEEEGVLSDVIRILDKQIYQDTLRKLDEGETITPGTVGDAALGLQEMLAGFGCDIALDSSAGPGTFAALNNVLTSFGMEPTETVDAALYRELLPMLLISANEEEAANVLLNEFTTEDEAKHFDYLRACALYAKGQYYSAREAFEASRYGDYQERADACIQPWPQNGELWHNPGYYSQSMYLTFDVHTSYDNRGMYFEVFSENGDLAAALFVTGSGTATTSLPGGNYRIKDATGYDAWYGMKDAFGPDGYYEDLIFHEFEQDDKLTALPGGYEWTISINSSTGGGTGVGARSSSWESRTDG